MADKINFTVTSLQGVKCPANADRVYVYDTKTPRLAFCRTANDSASFYLYYRSPEDGRPKRYLIGGYPDITIEQARNEAAKLNGEIAKGIDPQTARKAGRGAITFGALFKAYIDGHAKKFKRTWKEDEQKYNLHLKVWENRKANSITRHEVRTLHVKIGDEAKGAANRTLALISKVFNWGADMGVKENPAKGVERFPEKQRKRFLQPDEMPRFFEALKLEPSAMMRDFFSLCLLTGARRGNVAGMRWEHLNLQAGVWTVPDELSKSGDAMLIHLSEAAIDILLRRLQEQREKREQQIADGEILPASPPCPWVFPSNSATGHLQEPKKSWAALLSRAGISDLRIHDLRRTLGSWQAALGSSLNVIGASLGHKQIATTQIYARLNLDPVKKSVDAATAAIFKAAKPRRKSVKSKALPEGTR